LENIGKFLAMGGYALYVWPAVAVAVIILAALAWQSWRARARARRALAALEARRP